VADGFYIEDFTKIFRNSVLLCPDICESRYCYYGKNQNWKDCPCDFEPVVTVRLERQLVGVGTPTEANRYVNNSAFNKNEYYRCNPEYELE